MRVFENCNAIVKGHFVYAKGNSNRGPASALNPRRHGPIYVAKERVYISASHLSALTKMIVNELEKNEIFIDLVAGVSPIASVLAHHVADYLNCYAIAAEKRYDRTVDSEALVLRDSFKEILIPERKVLIVEDVVNTGGSSIELRQLIEGTSGTPVTCVAALWNRNKKTAQDLGVELFFSLCDKQYPVWDAEACPLCKNGVPLNTDFGYGKEFLKLGY